MENLKNLSLAVSLERNEMRIIVGGSGEIYMDVPDVCGGGTKQK